VNAVLSMQGVSKAFGAVQALRNVSVDCHPASDAVVRDVQFAAWLAHLRLAYTPAQAKATLASWSHEDVYVPLDAELALLRSAGFRVELLWRRGAFAVIRAAR